MNFDVKKVLAGLGYTDISQVTDAVPKSIVLSNGDNVICFYIDAGDSAILGYPFKIAFSDDGKKVKRATKFNIMSYSYWHVVHKTAIVTAGDIDDEMFAFLKNLCDALLTADEAEVSDDAGTENLMESPKETIH